MSSLDDVHFRVIQLHYILEALMQLELLDQPDLVLNCNELGQI